MSIIVVKKIKIINFYLCDNTNIHRVKWLLRILNGINSNSITYIIVLI